MKTFIRKYVIPYGVMLFALFIAALTTAICSFAGLFFSTIIGFIVGAFVFYMLGLLNFRSKA